MSSSLNPSPRERLLAVAEALARTRVAIEALEQSLHAARRALLPNHDAIYALADADTAAKVAQAKLEIVLRRIP